MKHLHTLPNDELVVAGTRFDKATRNKWLLEILKCIALTMIMWGGAAQAQSYAPSAEGAVWFEDSMCVEGSNAVSDDNYLVYADDAGHLTIESISAGQGGVSLLPKWSSSSLPADDISFSRVGVWAGDHILVWRRNGSQHFIEHFQETPLGLEHLSSEPLSTMGETCEISPRTTMYPPLNASAGFLFEAVCRGPVQADGHYIALVIYSSDDSLLVVQPNTSTINALGEFGNAHFTKTYGIPTINEPLPEFDNFLVHAALQSDGSGRLFVNGSQLSNRDIRRPHSVRRPNGKPRIFYEDSDGEVSALVYTTPPRYGLRSQIWRPGPFPATLHLYPTADEWAAGVETFASSITSHQLRAADGSWSRQIDLDWGSDSVLDANLSHVSEYRLSNDALWYTKFLSVSNLASGKIGLFSAYAYVNGYGPGGPHQEYLLQSGLCRPRISGSP